jgi:hypothetical protein
MTKRTALICLGGLVAMSLVGCGDSTDVSVDKNKAYHEHDAGPKPPAGAMTPPSKAVGPFAGSGGVAPGSPQAPYSGAGSGPGSAPPGAGATSGGGGGASK